MIIGTGQGRKKPAPRAGERANASVQLVFRQRETGTYATAAVHIRQDRIHIGGSSRVMNRPLQWGTAREIHRQESTGNGTNEAAIDEQRRTRITHHGADLVYLNLLCLLIGNTCLLYTSDAADDAPRV